MRKRVLITGAAGFIGYHLAKKMIKLSYDVCGLDIINDYYDVNLKNARIANLGINHLELEYCVPLKSKSFSNFTFIKIDLVDHEKVLEFCLVNKFDYIVNLAAQAGVRYSIDNPRAYVKSNIDGFLSVLEAARISDVKHVIYASTSSVYGLNSQMPLIESMPTEHPMSFYAATKKANEMMAHSYSHLYKLPTTGLRFFTVYGPWGRPDMALFLFADCLTRDVPINLFNNGEMIRDFTYVDDIVESITRLIEKPPRSENESWDSRNPKIDTSSAPYSIFNIGNGSPVQLLRYIRALEDTLGKKAKFNMMGMQQGDVVSTHADTKKLESYLGFKPNTTIESGIREFVRWYLDYYRK